MVQGPRREHPPDRPVLRPLSELAVRFVGEPDPTPIDSKGVGEIGLAGTAAAIADAVYHPTGGGPRQCGSRDALPPLVRCGRRPRVTRSPAVHAAESDGFVPRQEPTGPCGRFVLRRRSSILGRRPRRRSCLLRGPARANTRGPVAVARSTKRSSGRGALRRYPKSSDPAVGSVSVGTPAPPGECDNLMAVDPRVPCFCSEPKPAVSVGALGLLLLMDRRRAD